MHSSISNLNPDTVQLYLQATVKVFGFWASELAQRWDNDDLSKVKEVVDFIVSRMTDFASSPDIEVQERVGEHPSPPSRTMSNSTNVFFVLGCECAATVRLRPSGPCVIQAQTRDLRRRHLCRFKPRTRLPEKLTPNRSSVLRVRSQSRRRSRTTQRSSTGRA